MKKTDTLVVGQGIAGSLVAFMLHRQHIPFMVIDAVNENSSSRVAAGMFTPISGKRKTIHPMVPQQISFAIEIYKAIGQLVGNTILHPANIYQVHNSVAEQNELVSRLADVGYAKYILAHPAELPGIKQDLGAFEITDSGWVDCGLMINGFAKWLKEKELLTEGGFLYDRLQIGKTGMAYQGIAFDHIIFCEGYQAINNPFFKNENIIPCKGELLTIEYDGPATDRIIKKNGIYFISVGGNLFKAGATYQWNNCKPEPDEAGKQLIEIRLDSMLGHKFTTVYHQSGIRPTTQSREVIAKQHPQYANMFMLNGLGTKGVLQGPWWAKNLVEQFIAGDMHLIG